MIFVKTTGSSKETEAFLKNVLKIDVLKIMESCAKEGVTALRSATPLESGRAADSWGYESTKQNGKYTITWTNSDVEEGFPVVIMLQYGYGTGTGGYVEGTDFINPAIKPIFDKIADKVWRAVISA